MTFARRICVHVPEDKRLTHFCEGGCSDCEFYEELPVFVPDKIAFLKKLYDQKEPFDLDRIGKLLVRIDQAYKTHSYSEAVDAECDLRHAFAYCAHSILEEIGRGKRANEQIDWVSKALQQTIRERDWVLERSGLTSDDIPRNILDGKGEL